MQPGHRILDPAAGRGVAENTSALAVMTKAPRAGQVKTRLSPPLSPEEAAQLNLCFLRDTAAAITSCTGRLRLPNRARGVAVYTPIGAEAAYIGILPHRDFDLLPQRGAGFGERLNLAAADLFCCGFASVCLIDSDSPTLPSEALTSAVALLEQPGERVVLGPAEDGGYYLIGVKAAYHRLFADIAWSTDRVFGQTVERAEEARLDIEVLPRWYDVDDGPNLDRLCEELLGGGGGPCGSVRGYRAPHTRHYLTQLLASSRERFWLRPRLEAPRSR